MSALDAVEQILTLAGEPLGYREITRRTLADSLWQSDGATPEATVNARLAVDIKTLGAKSRFQRTSKGIFALRQWRLPEYLPAPKRNGNVDASPTDQPPALSGASTTLQQLPAEASDALDPLSFTDATEQVLDLYADHKPLHYRDITQRALDLGLIGTAGKTPEATLYASVLQEIGRRTRRGETPRFMKH